MPSTRRSVLLGATGALAALAGCNESTSDGPRSTVTPVDVPRTKAEALQEAAELDWSEVPGAVHVTDDHLTDAIEDTERLIADLRSVLERGEDLDLQELGRHVQHDPREIPERAGARLESARETGPSEEALSTVKRAVHDVGLAVGYIEAELGDLDSAATTLTRIGRVLPWPHAQPCGAIDASGPAVYTLCNLGELALVILREADAPSRTGLPLGRLAVPDSDNGEVYVETRVRGSVARGGEQQLTGTLFVRGAGVPAGPFDKAGALARSLLRRDAHGYLDTGIRCTVEAGTAERFRCERDGDLLYHGGVAIPAAELDRIYAAYPDFLDAAAFAFEDPVMGERIFAAIVPRPDRAPSLADFRRFLAEKGMALYKAPDQLVIVNAIPREPGGAVLRERLPDHI
jgi:hypothetical protein